MSQALFSLNNNNKKNNLACCLLGTLRVRGNFFQFFIFFLVAENRLRTDSRYVAALVKSFHCSQVSAPAQCGKRVFTQ